jgi:membrane-associated phospholipid phosphatase
MSRALVRNRLVRLGGPIAVNELAAVLFLSCLVMRKWHAALLTALAVPGAEALSEFLLKPLIGRTLHGALSFPSGHTTGVFALASAFSVVISGPLRPRLRTTVRWRLLLVAFLIASAVGVALVAVGAHYFTDTVAGAAVGTGTVLAIALMLDKLAEHRQVSGT